MNGQPIQEPVAAHARCAWGWDESPEGQWQRQTDVVCDVEKDIHGLLAEAADASRMGAATRWLLGMSREYPVGWKAAITLMGLYDAYGEIPGTVAQREAMNAFVTENLHRGEMKRLLRLRMVILDGQWYRLGYAEIYKRMGKYKDRQEEDAWYSRIFPPVDEMVAWPGVW